MRLIQKHANGCVLFVGLSMATVPWILGYCLGALRDYSINNDGDVAALLDRLHFHIDITLTVIFAFGAGLAIYAAYRLIRPLLFPR